MPEFAFTRQLHKTGWFQQSVLVIADNYAEAEAAAEKHMDQEFAEGGHYWNDCGVDFGELDIEDDYDEDDDWPTVDVMTPAPTEEESLTI